jgi:hypothetical protein
MGQFSTVKSTPNPQQNCARCLTPFGEHDRPCYLGDLSTVRLGFNVRCFNDLVMLDAERKQVALIVIKRQAKRDGVVHLQALRRPTKTAKRRPPQGLLPRLIPLTASP